MAAFGAHVGAKLQRAVGRVRLHELDDHRPCAHRATGGRHGRQPLFRSHLSPFRQKRRCPVARAHRVTSHPDAARSCHSSVLILVMMQVARDLSSQLRRLPEVSKGRSVVEELPLDVGRESGPSHHDGRTQTVQNMRFLGERLIHPPGAPRCRPFFVWKGRKSATFVIPPCNSGGMVARITLRFFSRGHVHHMGLMTAAHQ